MKNRKGIELLRYAVHLFSSTNEDFNQRFNEDELLKIADAVQKCEWDIYPDQWSEKQVQDYLISEIIPNWDYDENNKLVPIYSLLQQA